MKEEGYDEFPQILNPIHTRNWIHPAVSIANDALHFGFKFPIEVAGDSITKELCFINSNKEIFSAVEHNLARRNLKLDHRIKMAHSRTWDANDIQAYLNEENRANYKDLPFEIYQELRKYIELKDHGCYLLTSLWIIGTYLQPIWKAYPYLSITGTKRTGKSKMLEFLAPLAFNSLLSASISTASLFRMIQDIKPTFLLDESEKYSSSDRQNEMRNILQCGYKRTSGWVFRTSMSNKKYGVPEQFSSFCPKAMVSYKGIEGVLEDRCIPITMIRSTERSIVDTEIEEDESYWQSLKNKLYRFALDYFRDIQKIYEDPVREINSYNYMSRERQLWKPILSLAKYFGILNNIIPYAKTQMESKRLEDIATSKELHLLEALRQLVTEPKEYLTADIKSKMIEIYQEYAADITEDWIGKTLSRQFGFTRRGTKSSKRTWFLDPKSIQMLCMKYGLEIEKQNTFS